MTTDAEKFEFHQRLIRLVGFAPISGTQALRAGLLPDLGRAVALGLARATRAEASVGPCPLVWFRVLG
jgi:hypothetical protein